ncbi:MAG: hypothetical protein AAF236_03545 [Verrucomicrobiota bacterium]
MLLPEFLARGSVWVAMAGWTVGCIADRRSAVAARFAFLLAWVAFAVHIVLTFDVFYNWSWAKGWDETARITAEVTGLASGIGLIVNFLFFAVLSIDLWFRWRGRRWIHSLALLILIAFMILNGAVIFADGPVRWFGCILLIALLIGAIRRSPSVGKLG